jgi:hypothetical protein
MNIQGKLTGDVVGVLTKTNKTFDGRETFVDIDCPVSREEGLELFGEVFEKVAFGSMVMATNDDGETTPTHYQDNPKPGSKVVFEKHTYRVVGHDIVGQPEFRGIKTIQGEERVMAKLRLPVETDSPAVELLRQKAGRSPVTVEFTPTQAQLAFSAKRGESAVERINNAAEAEEAEPDDDVEVAAHTPDGNGWDGDGATA